MQHKLNDFESIPNGRHPMCREKSEPKKWTGQFSQQNAEQRCTT